MKANLKKFFPFRSRFGYQYYMAEAWLHRGLIQRALRAKLKGYNKVFSIGFNKTGTTSLEAILQEYNFRMPYQGTQEKILTTSASKLEYRKIRGFIDKFDAFQDLPFSNGMFFIACDALFPNSKFILTVRDEDEWFRSLLRFHKKVFQFDDEKSLSEDFLKKITLGVEEEYVYKAMKRMITIVDENYIPTPRWDLLYNEEYFKYIYRERNKNIVRYFSERPDKLLIVDLTKEKDTEKICNFLNIPQKSNSNSSFKQTLVFLGFFCGE